MVYNLTSTPAGQTVSQQKLTTKHLTLKDMQKFTSNKSTVIKTAVCADISGSMSGNKIAEVRRMLSIVMTTGTKGIAFSDVVYELEPSDIAGLQTQGGTNMLLALNTCWDEQFKHMILMTDGQPTGSSKEDILIACAQHKDIPIDTIGIGDIGGGGYDPDFLREIARITGGRFTDCGEPIRLTAMVQDLLEHRPDSLLNAPLSGGAIQL